MSRLGVSIGDVNGIGIEILIKAFKSLKPILMKHRLIIFGDYYHINYYLKKFKGKIKPGDFPVFIDYTGKDSRIPGVYEVSPLNLNPDYQPEPGTISKVAGEIAYESITTASNEIKKKNIDSLVTLPIAKESIRLTGCDKTGHTTILEDYFKKRITMVFMSKVLNVVLITIHLPINRVSESITVNAITQKVKLVYNFFSRRNKKLRFLLLALNPHAGENGLLGYEEKRVIIPAVKRLTAAGLNISGPKPPDTAFTRNNISQYDFFICMYHDQGLIPFKMLTEFNACQVSVGLDFVRTSVSHGTGFDIAGKGIASPESFIYAVMKNIELIK
ncbi:MAG TPA: 4-hydroxythreonine-4-phosphate dehydrogenase PdxA [Firmicutes bacterium]|nr:4-hydroxythreonine-4-phosphate dehydrogenase PdxA [Bacillota bacterium]